MKNFGRLINKYLAFIIFFFSLLLRVILIAKFPVGFTPDEASFGYDAFSILKTGRDQWGSPFPLVLKSFGDYKAPLMTYLQIPFVAILGLNKTSVRLPNAILGSLAVLITYFLVKEFFKDKKISINSDKLALIAEFILAISPWQMMLSRGAFEANLTTFFLPLGFYLFIKGLTKTKYLVFSALVFGLNLFSYHSAKLITPLMILFLAAYYFKELKKIEFKKLILPVLVFTVFFGFTLFTFGKGAGARVSERSIMNGALQEAAERRIKAVFSGTNTTVARLLHNKYLVFVKRFTNNYLQYISPKFLFREGPKEGTYGMIPGEGVLLYPEIILLLGVLFALIDKKLRILTLPFLFWVLIGIVPAALASGVGYSANRAVGVIPGLTILLTIGFLRIIELLNKLKIKISIKYLISVFVIFEIIAFVFILKSYFIDSPKKVASQMLYHNLETFEWIDGNFKKDVPILVSRRLSEPHIYTAFAGKTDPKLYQEASKSWNFEEIGVNWVDQIPSYKLDRFTFEYIEDISFARSNINVFVGKPEEFSGKVKIIKDFKYLDGTSAVWVVQI